MPAGIRDRVAILGMGCSKFGERWDCDADDLIIEAYEECLKDAGIESVRLIGDAYAPGAIVHAVYSGHRYARELDTEDPGDAVPFRREIKALSDEAWPGVPA